MVVGKSIALATNLRPSIVRPSHSLTPVARPLATLSSFASAFVMISPPPAPTTRAADRQCKAGDIGKDRRKDDSRAWYIFGRDHVHIGREQCSNAFVDKMLPHDTKEIVLGMRKQFFCLGSAQPVDQLLARHRC